MTGNPSFDLFKISEDHEALRAAVRAVAEDKIAPYAASVDEEARYPQEAHDALVASDFFAPHIGEEYGGVGADALATCIVIEEIARVDASASDFLKVELPDVPACLVLDVRLPGTSGLELQAYLAGINVGLPVILMTGYGDIPMSVRAMKLGAVDFLTKPIRNQDLLDAVAVAIRKDGDRRLESAHIAQLREKYALLTARERQVMALVASGLMNKQVAQELSISEVTVKMHRGSLMRKLEAKSLATLARMAETLDIER